MALLKTDPHWEILDIKRIYLLRDIAQKVNLPDAYMAGGTALSLQLGLRSSVDFDFFTPTKFSAESLFGELKNIFKKSSIKGIDVYGGTCNVSIDDVQVSWFYYPYAILQPQIAYKELPGLTLANPRDIAAMKLVALGGRGTKKDFFDLYQIMNRTNMTVKDLAESLFEKFGSEHNYFHICKAMTYFDEANKNKLGDTFVPYSWNAIKKYFKEIQPDFEKEIREFLEQHRELNVEGIEKLANKDKEEYDDIGEDR